ncbi:hypothetical protein BANRA_01252 [Escherichia coli]|nr:hypothetical protein BANRA_01252 [Escherichia coli]
MLFFLKMFAILIFSLAVNIPFIYMYGMCGAAAATLLTELFSLTVFNYLFRRGLVLKCICKHSFQELVIDNFDLLYYRIKDLLIPLNINCIVLKLCS